MAKNISGKKECKDWRRHQSARGVWWKQFAIPPGTYGSHILDNDVLPNLLVGQLNFLYRSYSAHRQEVTSDVLARGIFSERGLKSAIDSAVTARLGKVGF